MTAEHRGLGAGVGEADQLGARDALTEHFGELDLGIGRPRPGGSAGHRPRRLADGRVGMPVHQAQAVAEEVDVLVAVASRSTGPAPRSKTADRGEPAQRPCQTAVMLPEALCMALADAGLRAVYAASIEDRSNVIVCDSIFGYRSFGMENRDAPRRPSSGVLRTRCARRSRTPIVGKPIGRFLSLRRKEKRSLSIERITTDPSTGFSDAVTTTGSGRVIHVSGNVGFGEDGKVVSGGMGAEARATFANIERVLAAAGAGLSDVVKITTFITDLESYPAYAAVRSEVFGDQLPASSTVQVAGLLVGAQIEIEAVAFLPEG